MSLFHSVYIYCAEQRWMLNICSEVQHACLFIVHKPYWVTVCQIKQWCQPCHHQFSWFLFCQVVIYEYKIKGSPEYQYFIVNKSLILIDEIGRCLAYIQLFFTNIYIYLLFKKSETYNLVSSSSFSQGVWWSKVHTCICSNLTVTTFVHIFPKK